MSWRYRKPLYDAAVTAFVNSGRTWPNEPWRSKDITEDQESLITTLCDLLDMVRPPLNTRGEAFDWIYKQGGNPEFWNEPPVPEGWSE